MEQYSFARIYFLRGSLMLDMAILDMDGVIFEGKNFWLDFHELMGTRRQAMQLWRGLHKNDYNLLSSHTARIWAGKSTEYFWRLIENRTLVAGIDHLLNYLHENLIPCAIVSSGPYQLAERAQCLLPITTIRANKLLISSDGCFTGAVDVQVDDGKKHLAAIAAMKEFGARSKFTAMIGDTFSDATIARVANISIAFNTNDNDLIRACRYRITSRHIDDAIPILKQYVVH